MLLTSYPVQRHRPPPLPPNGHVSRFPEGHIIRLPVFNSDIASCKLLRFLLADPFPRRLDGPRPKF